MRDGSRQPASLTFVIDTSGSMEREGRLELVKDALRLLVDGLDRRDTIAIVTFGDDGRVLLRPTPASDANAILGVIEQLQPGGSTNLEAGLRLGYDLARESLTENGIDRVVLASDGVANVGLTDPESILGAIERDAQAGIELVSVGVGMGNYNDTLLEQLADKGDGFYAYVNVLDEARRLFAEDLTGTLQTVALDAKAQVEFDPDIVAAYRLVGYENRDIADNAFVDPNVEAGAIGAGHAVTALYALRLREDVGPQDVLGTVRLRWTDPESGEADEVERADPDERSRPHLRGRRSLLPVRRDRGRHGRGPARRARGPSDSTLRPSPTSPTARLAGCPRRTRSTGSSTCSTGWPGWATKQGHWAGRCRGGTPRSGRLAGVRVVAASGGPDRRATPRRPWPTVPAVSSRARPSTMPFIAASSASANSTMKARISECSVQAACGMSAGHRTASPAATRVRSSPTPTQPPPSMTMSQVVFGAEYGSIRAPRANASSEMAPRSSLWIGCPVTPVVPAGPSGRR